MRMCFKVGTRVRQLVPRPGRSGAGEVEREVVGEVHLTGKKVCSQWVRRTLWMVATHGLRRKVAADVGTGARGRQQLPREASGS